MIRLAVYLAFGIIFHVLFVGSHFDPANLWSWLWLIGWPVALFVTFGVAVVAIWIVCVGVLLAVERFR